MVRLHLCFLVRYSAIVVGRVGCPIVVVAVFMVCRLFVAVGVTLTLVFVRMTLALVFVRMSFALVFVRVAFAFVLVRMALALRVV